MGVLYEDPSLKHCWAAAPMITMMKINKMHFKRLATLLCSLLFFVGCSSFPVNQTSETPIKISTQEVFATSTNIPVATPDFSTPTAPQVVETEQPYHCIFIDDWKEPSGAWAALSVQCQNPGSPRVEVLSFDRKHWSFELRQYDTRYAYFLYEWSYQWNTDHKYLYFYSLLTWPWDSEWNKYQPARGLFRMNLSDGETDIILDEREYLPYNAVSLSPDEESIVYLSLHSSDKVIGVRNIQTAKEETAFIDGFDDGGNFLWSPNKQKIAFVLSNLKYDDFGFAFPEKETVFVLDTDAMALEQVYSAETKEKTVEPISWEGQNLVIKDGRYNYLISVDLQTGKETKFYPTATPTP
jgi:hypothetical protein